MTFDDFCLQTGFDGKAKELLKSVWDESLQSAPEGVPEFMTMPFCRKYYPLTGGAPEHLKRMEQVCRIVELKKEAALLAWILHYSTFLRMSAINFSVLPLPEKTFGENAGIFQLMIALSALPMIESTMKRMNIPEQYAHDIAKWLDGTIQIFAAAHNGIPGHTLSQMSWIRHYVDGKLFRIGRFEYLLHTCPEWVPAIYRNRKDGSLTVFCRDNWRFLPSGKRPLNTSPDTEVIRTHLKILNGYVTGTPISPRGEIVPGQEVTIDLGEWEGICQPWELIPSIHIPGGGGMKPELAKQSLLDAKKFFRKYFNQDIKMFVCCSWILNPDWETELPDSNLAKFMSEGYMTPAWESNGRDGTFFVFGRDDADPLTYPAQNTMQKAFHRILKSGRPLRSGAIFFLSDKLESFGTQYYRSFPIKRDSR